MFEPFVGQTLDHYALLRLLGEDSLGALFQAYDNSSQREVALRIIHPSLAAQPGFLENFSQLARQDIRLDHPNLIQVYDSGEARSVHYLVMEYIPGDSLAALLQAMRHAGQWLPLSEAVGIVRQLALAMAYIRSQEAPARTPTPSQVKIRPLQSGRLPYLPVLTDLGLARVLRVEEALEPAYLSPEAAQGQREDARSEVYALGVLLFELAAGQLPFPVQTREEAVRYHTRQPLPPPRSIRPDLPEGLSQAITRALEKNPDLRFADPAALANELERAGPAAERVTAPPPAFEQAVSLLAAYLASSREESRNAPTMGITTPSGGGAPPPRAEPPAAPLPTPAGGQLDLLVENPQLSVEPGNVATTSLTVLNNSSSAGNFRVSLEGLPPAWFSLVPQMVQLRPGEQKQVTLTIQPPQSPQSRAGRYPLTLKAASQGIPARTGETRAALTLAAFSHFSSQVEPARFLAGGLGQVKVSNQGNTQETYTFHFRDPSGALTFTPPQTPLRLTEGQTGVAEFRADLRQPRLFGGSQVHPYHVMVTSGSGASQTLAAEVESRPPIPLWVLGALAAVLVCFLLGLALLYSQSGLQASRATATSLAAQTGTIAALQGTALAETATALSLVNANQATLDAVTATAAWLAADDDGDGLSNQRELELGTLPNNPDTDKDGLGDGEEVQRGTNPLIQDTDGDGLLDGEEVQGGTNPLNPDTDGDGIPDAQDPNPLATSTPSINPQATVAAGLTQTALSGLEQTQAAGSVNATVAAATAAAGTQTAIALATQGSIAGTAAAETAIAGTAVMGTAVAGTATAIAALTLAAPTVPPPVEPARRAAYIFLTSSREAKDYQTLLQAHNIQTDLIPQDAIPGTDFSQYQVIVIGPDTGNQDIWGNPDGSWASAVLNTGLPIMGLGEGGFAFFGKAQLGPGFPNGATGSGSQATVMNPADPVWKTPFVIPIPQDQVLGLYQTESPWTVVTVSGAPPGIVLLAREPSDPAHYLIVRQDRYLLWGFSLGPGDMTPTGQQAFLNLLRSLVP